MVAVSSHMSRHQPQFHSQLLGLTLCLREGMVGADHVGCRTCGWVLSLLLLAQCRMVRGARDSGGGMGEVIVKAFRDTHGPPTRP